MLEKLNKRDRQGYYRPWREPYRNSYVAKLRQDIRERLAYNYQFQRDNLNKREQVALKRLSHNKDIIIKQVDKGGATVILNMGDYIMEVMQQLNNEEYYKRVEEDLTSQHKQLINQCISDLTNNGDLDMDTGQLLRPANSRNQFFTCFPKSTNPIIRDDLLPLPLTAIRRNYLHMWMSFSHLWHKHYLLTSEILQISSYY